MVHATCCQKQVSCTKGTGPVSHSVAPRDGYTWCEIDVCRVADSVGHPQQTDQGTRYRYSGFSPQYHCLHPAKHQCLAMHVYQTAQCIKQQAISNTYSLYAISHSCCYSKQADAVIQLLQYRHRYDECDEPCLHPCARESSMMQQHTLDVFKVKEGMEASCASVAAGC